MCGEILKILYLRDRKSDEASRIERCLDAIRKTEEFQRMGRMGEAEHFFEEEMPHRLIIAVELDEYGTNTGLDSFIRELRGCEETKSLSGAVCGMIIDGRGDLYTKDVARKLALALSNAGATLPGKPLVEATGSLRNFDIIARNMNTDNMGAYIKSCTDLVRKVVAFDIEEYIINMPQILAIHASSRRTSNSLALWGKVARYLEGRAGIKEVQIRNGKIWDCRGCKFEQCLHHGESDTCFYGGQMVEEVYPALLKSDIIVFICPNYNDSVSADIMAVINRLTALFRTNDFSRKRVYAIVVSGYSGGDLVAQQILGALNMNKNFMLPGGFSLLATANNPGSIEKVKDIDYLAEEFADRIMLEER